MSFEHFERGYLLPGGCKDLIDVIRLQSRPGTDVLLKSEKPLLTAVCSNCEATCFVRLGNPESSHQTELNEIAHPGKTKVPFVCPRCGHKQFADTDV